MKEKDGEKCYMRMIRCSGMGVELKPIRQQYSITIPISDPTGAVFHFSEFWVENHA